MLRTILVIALAQLHLAFPAATEPSRNIAGDYRGLLTACQNAAAPSTCRRDLSEIVRLAVEVDTRRADWEATRAGNDRALTANKHADYSSASEKLNHAVLAFNRTSPRQ